MDVNKNIVTKKSRKWFYDCFRQRKNDQSRAVLVNSIPKSGTHLATKVLTSVGYKDYGGFLASTPSFSMRLQSERNISRKLSSLYDKEMCSGHIFHSQLVEETVRDINLPVVFIYRDPREVFVSEINYLSSMNKWHKCHKYYSDATDSERFDICLNGIENNSFFYPSFRERIEAYLGWMESDVVLAVDFDQLRSGRIEEFISDLNAQFSAQFKYDACRFDEVFTSHTYTGLAPDRWKSILSPMQIDQLNASLASVLEKMGYHE